MILKVFCIVIIYLCAIAVSGIQTIDSNLKGFDDSILFKINWPGKDGVGAELLDLPEFQQMTVTTENHEKYTCVIPHLQEKESDVHEKYGGANALELLSPLFSQTSCSYRLEAFWTYELCHGKYVRQYHEEREGKKVKLQEFYLGRWDKMQQDKLKSQIETDEKTRTSDHVPVKKIDGLNMPYVELNMTDGTLCDLTSKPRQTKVLYVCYAHGKHEIYSLKETSICEYEVIILSPLLCSHPRYRPQESSEYAINCLPVENSPKKPYSLLQFEFESLKLRHQKTSDGKGPTVFAVFSVPGQEGSSRVRVEIHPMDVPEGLDSQTNPAVPFAVDPGTQTDSASLNNFLAGKDCIQGGSGWWKYEFCYGKSVIQYHLEKDGSKVIVNLGHFIKAAHLEWLEGNPHKRPKPLGSRKHISHYYTGGTICDKTGKPRQTEVKLKCLESGVSSQGGAVSLYLLEPKTCHYILGVESQLICQLLTKVDENGLTSSNEDMGFSRADYSTGYKPYREDREDREEGSAQREPEGPQQKVKINLLDEDDELDNHIPDGDE